MDDYVDGFRATSKTPVVGQAFRGVDSSRASQTRSSRTTCTSTTGLGKGSFEVGRFPLQFTPYTLKKIDVDSYTTILKTDDGNYPVDGIKAGYNFGGVDVTLFAVKNDENSFLINGLTGQPNAGLFDANGGHNQGFAFFKPVTGPSAIASTHVAGNLDDAVSQTAGGRVAFGTPWKGNIGLPTTRRGLSRPGSSRRVLCLATATIRLRVFGADLAVPFGNWGVAGSWTQSDTLASDLAPAGIPDVTDDNTAWDAQGQRFVRQAER